MTLNSKTLKETMIWYKFFLNTMYYHYWIQIIL